MGFVHQGMKTAAQDLVAVNPAMRIFAFHEPEQGGILAGLFVGKVKHGMAIDLEEWKSRQELFVVPAGVEEVIRKRTKVAAVVVARPVPGADHVWPDKAEHIFAQVVFMEPHPVRTLPGRYQEHHIKIKTMRSGCVLPNAPVVDLKMLQRRCRVPQRFMGGWMLKIYVAVAIAFQQRDTQRSFFSGHRMMDAMEI